jgi:signal peptide peptidase SppA
MMTLSDLFVDESVLAISARGLEQLGARLASLSTTALTGPAGGRDVGRVATVGRGVVVLRLHGPLGYRPSLLLSVLGGTSYLEFSARRLEAVALKPRAIVIDVHSPGGGVWGLEELAAEVRDARRLTRIVAVANPLTASAAYYLAAQAHSLVITPSGQVGSIGTILTHFDLSGAFERDGVRVRVMRATGSPRKSLGNPFEPLTDDGAAEIQRELDRYQAAFVRDVARGRGVSTAFVERMSGGGVMFGSAEAVHRGLADGVGTFDETLNWAQSGAGEHPATLVARERRAMQDLAVLEERVQRAELRALDAPAELEALERRAQAPITARALRRELSRL